LENLMSEPVYHFAERVKYLSESATVSIMDKARKMQAAGQSVVDLSGGEPDFRTAPHIVAAAVKALQDGFTHYTPSRGFPELLNAIAHKLETDNNAQYNPKTEILVLPGGKQALFITLQAILNPGDEVILFDPCWVSYAPMTRLASAVPVYVSMDRSTTLDDLKTRLEKAINPRTRMIIINTPNNPTGRIWTQTQLEMVAGLAQAHDLLVVTDEIYETLIYDGAKHVSIAGLPGMNSRTFVLNGMSKSHAMTGWRLGYVAGPQPYVSQMLKVHQQSTTCATSFVQKAGVAALQGPDDENIYNLSRYKIRRDALVSALNEIPGVVCELPEGAFYAFPNIAATGLDSVTFSSRLLEQECVALTPGVAFGPAGEGFVRLSFANSDEMLAEAAVRMRRFVSNL
jgi:aspartate aminotransferase